MAASGGSPVQLTFESGGAFDPVWSADGATVLYTTSNGTMVVRSVNVATGATTTYASGTSDLGQPSCAATMCLVVSGAYGSTGDIIGYTSAGAQPKMLVSRGSNDVHPAVLMP
jgi:Tol biopolymer transport system component